MDDVANKEDVEDERERTKHSSNTPGTDQC